jgi:hypothetical protein
MTIFEKIKRLGVVSSLSCLMKTLYLFFLQRKYGFDYWHIRGDYICKPYKKQVVDIVNSLPNMDVAVDVGCGMGDILARTNIKNRIGIDIDQKVIDCALFLRQDLTFYRGMIAINWTHNICFDDLVNNFSKVINKYSHNCYILVDIIKPDIENYKYKHSIEDYAKYFKISSSVVSVDGVRIFLTLSKL